jgi:hypothetical protein
MFKPVGNVVVYAFHSITHPQRLNRSSSSWRIPSGFGTVFGEVSMDIYEYRWDFP